MKFERELLKGIAPVVVLEILSRGRMYGYELGDAINQRSDNILNLGRGTLYPLLYNLEAKGLVQADWQESESGRRRRYYEITSKGREKLANKKEQCEQLQTGGNRIFGLLRSAEYPQTGKLTAQ